MFQIAKISFDDGALLLPASDPYDRELVFEQADFYARRHGSVAVQIGRAKLRAARAGESRFICARCGSVLRAVTFHVGERRFCTQCAKRSTIGELLHPPH